MIPQPCYARRPLRVTGLQSFAYKLPDNHMLGLSLRAAPFAATPRAAHGKYARLRLPRQPVAGTAGYTLLSLRRR